MNTFKKLLVSILRLLPIWTILGWVAEYAEEKAKKTETQIDDIAVEMLKALIEVMQANEDTLFGGTEKAKPALK